MTSEVSHPVTGTDELLQGVLSSIRDAVCVLSGDGRILSSNDAWAELGLQLSTEAPLNSICEALVGDSSGATVSCRRRFATRRVTPAHRRFG